MQNVFGKPFSWKDLALVLTVAVLARIALGLVFPVMIAIDSASYIDLARMIAAGNFAGFNGARTPVFPLLLLVCNFNPSAVVLVQHLLGVLDAGIVYLLFLRLTGNRFAALAAGLVTALNPGLIVLERALVTETISAFLVTASVAVVLYPAKPEEGGRVWGLLAALSLSLAVLARPNLVYLSILLGAGLLRTGKRFRRAVPRALVVAVPGIVVVLLWSGVVYRYTGKFTPSTMGGFALTMHVGQYIEDAPPEYDTIKRIYLKYRPDRIAERGQQGGTIWNAYREMLDSLGVDFPELDYRLKKMARALILRHPARYAVDSAKAFFLFFRPEWFTGQGGIRAAILNGGPAMKLLVGGFVLADMFLGACFLLLPVVWLLWNPLRVQLAFDVRWFLLYATVLVGAVLLALATYGGNPRYGVPFEPLYLSAGAVGLLAGLKVLKHGKEKIRE